MFDLGDKSELANILRAMRSTCRKFFDSVQGQLYFDKGQGRIDHDHAMGGQSGIELYLSNYLSLYRLPFREFS